MKRRIFVSGLLSGTLITFQKNLFALQEQVARAALTGTGFFSDPIFLQHHIDAGHPESPERIRYIHSAIKQFDGRAGFKPLEFDLDPGKWLTSVHTREHVDAIGESFPLADKVAKAAAGACIAATEQVVSGIVTNAFCATRPPGHHALNTGREEGFCYYNNVAVAARYAQQGLGLEKILIIDWDYHHGNSTEAMFYDDPSVMFFSTHDQYAYPGTGSPARKGRGRGLGYNINVHLPCGTRDRDIINVFESQLVPAANSFSPDLVLISAGFDSRQDDLLGCFDITDSGFRKLTGIAMGVAETHCKGRLVSILEGGYNLRGNASAVATHISTLLHQEI